MSTLIAVYLGILMANPAISGTPQDPLQEQVTLLAQRIDSYMSHFKRKDYASAYEMLAQEIRQGDHARKEWIRDAKQLDNGIRLRSCTPRRIWVHGSRAKVEMEIRGETRKSLFGWEPFSERGVDYWIFEDGNWAYMPDDFDDWDEASAIEVQVPHLPSTAHIESKD